MITSDMNPLPLRALALFFLATPFAGTISADGAPLLEFCEHSAADHQLRASKGTAGCVPLLEKKEPSASDDRTARDSTRQMKIENLQQEATAFLQRYNQFLECCRTDLAELRSVEELGNDVNDLLTMAQSGLFSEHMKLRGWTIAELLPPVAKARADLKRLHAKLEAIGDARTRLSQLDYESAAKESRRTSRSAHFRQGQKPEPGSEPVPPSAQASGKRRDPARTSGPEDHRPETSASPREAAQTSAPAGRRDSTSAQQVARERISENPG
jgi:Holliday junction resolvase-like predicted endonuclease